MEIAVAVVTALTALAVAVIEKRTRRDDEKWQQNSDEHNALVDRMSMIGSNLGRSLDRVEQNLTSQLSRLENKVERHDEVLYDHLASHAEMGVHMHAEEVPVKVPRKKRA